eukprot:gnl/TRDRNA2_/TRDRNA2_166356_c1_seq2.p1 gnl/TRDRNA2_/TRDRNA2_166356_c1~~gnl/TRDRNA2_/TRDRNA2_166356_c1_seq2.p1  ORF type:complete len:112 (-),score=14.63 gnl/TRDRNA2_/TRDRNA2_166356_c1_seq2:262-597(-)
MIATRRAISRDCEACSLQSCLSWLGRHPSSPSPPTLITQLASFSTSFNCEPATCSPESSCIASGVRLSASCPALLDWRSACEHFKIAQGRWLQNSSYDFDTKFTTKISKAG